MSIFFTAYFVKTQEPEQKIRKCFQRVEAVSGSEWLVCNLSRDYVTGLFEPGHYFTKDLSVQFGEVIFVCEAERDNQMEYEHSRNGSVIRKLSWIFDGNESAWEWVEGEKEAWEEAVLFYDDNFARTREFLSYEYESASEEELGLKMKELQTAWDHRKYILGGKWPLGNGTVPGAILKHLGLAVPLRFK